uniref:Uncharacterized protein n=1 Tax=Strongyloides venezuelensis TaxID=75913 RepID=A0A0K0G046_STRVS
MWVMKWRSISKRSRSKQRSDGEKQHINDIDKPDHLNNRVIYINFYFNIVESTPAKIDNVVKMRGDRGRSTIRGTLSKESYIETNQQIDDNNNVKQSIDKFDEILNKKSSGKTVENLTKDFDLNDCSLSRSKSVYARKSLGLQGSKSFFQRRHFLSHAATRIKRPS